jgi:hypothetical protein
MAWSGSEALSEALANLPSGDVGADAGAVTGAEAGAWAKADVMMPMVKAVNRIGRMCNFSVEMRRAKYHRHFSVQVKRRKMQ